MLSGGRQVSGGPPGFGPQDRQTFANERDRWWVKRLYIALFSWLLEWILIRVHCLKKSSTV